MIGMAGGVLFRFCEYLLASLPDGRGLLRAIRHLRLELFL